MPTEEELLDLEPIDQEFRYLEIKRPNDENLFEDEEYIEDVEKANNDLREKVIS